MTSSKQKLSTVIRKGSGGPPMSPDVPIFLQSEFLLCIVCVVLCQTRLYCVVGSVVLLQRRILLVICYNSLLRGLCGYFMPRRCTVRAHKSHKTNCQLIKTAQRVCCSVIFARDLLFAVVNCLVRGVIILLVLLGWFYYYVGGGHSILILQGLLT